jgi:excisionase family DNA binding protein
VSDEPLNLADRLALSVAEAARVLGVSKRHLESLLPELPHVRLGGRLVIPVGPLRKWLEKHCEIEERRIDKAVDEVLQGFDETGQHS